MLDLTRTTFGRVFEKEVAMAATIGAEGRLIQATMVNGSEVISEAAASGSLDLVGFSTMSMVTPDEVPFVEEAVVPAAAPYTIQLDKNNITPLMIRVYDATAASDLTEVAGAPAGTQYQCVDATGLLTFNAAEAGNDVVIYYRYNPTVLEARMNFWQAHVNRNSPSVFARVGVGCGKCQVYTSEFDPTQDYTAGSALTSGAGGIITIGGGGTTLPTGHRVISAPSAGDAWLGLEMSI